MDNIKSLMRSLDEVSSMIPDGAYLEMTDNLKQIYEKFPKNDDPPMIDRRSLPVNVPFQVVLPPDNLRPIRTQMELVRASRSIHEIEMRIHIIDDKLKTLKTRKNVTESVKREAIRDEAIRMGLLIHDLTWESLMSNFPVQFRGEERNFYLDYINQMNAKVEAQRRALEIEKEQLKVELDDLL
jgi:hypothetical protein|tara:strand:+ start:5795 stop:6343 length:549 start_codon:yes stop_codon:yes gene_type:complete